MTEREMTERIAELEAELADILEMVKNRSPTLEQALELHMRWLDNKKGGVRFHVCGDLDGAVLEGNLNGAVLENVELFGASLSGTQLIDANILGLTFKNLVLNIVNLIWNYFRPHKWYFPPESQVADDDDSAPNESKRPVDSLEMVSAKHHE